MKNSNYSFYYLPLLCQILCIYNLVLQRLGMPKLYLVVYVIAIFALITKPNNNSLRVTLHSSLLYVSVCFFIGVLYITFSDNTSEVFHGLMIYTLPVLYWIVYYYKGGDWAYVILYALRYHVLIVAIASIVQFFISPSLFGIYDDSNYFVSLAENNSDNVFLIFRSSSILTSPQCLGLFMGLYTVVYYLCFFKKKSIDYLFLFIFFIGGALSGSKSFYLMIVLTVLCTILTSKSKKTKIALIAAIMVVGIIVSMLYEYVGFVDRLLNMDKLVSDEKEGRLAIYSFFLNNSTLLGNGPGILQNITGKTYKYENAAESYFIQMIFEMGYIVFFLFVTFIFIAFCRKNSFKLLIMMITLSFGYVHAFNGFVFFIFWALFFVNKPQLIESSEPIDRF